MICSVRFDWKVSTRAGLGVRLHLLQQFLHFGPDRHNCRWSIADGRWILGDGRRADYADLQIGPPASSIGNGRIGFVLSDSGHLLRVFNNLVALLGIQNLRKVSGRLLQGLQQLVRLPGLPLGLGGRRPDRIGA